MAKNQNYLIITGITPPPRIEERTLYAGKEVPLKQAHKVLGEESKYGSYDHYNSTIIERTGDTITFSQEEISHFDPGRKHKETFCHRTSPKRFSLTLDEKTKKLFNQLFKS